MALDFDAVADELYGMAPQEFTAKRDSYAADARRTGDRELASEIKTLKRPTASAWLANQLVRQRPELVNELLDLGADMLDAQQRLDGEQLRRLSLRRRQLGSTIAEAARQLARAGGQPAGDAVERELESTLDAAVADPAAGEALRTGRLTTALSAAGFGRLDAPPSDADARRQRPAAPSGIEQQLAPSGPGGRRVSAGRLTREGERRLRREQEQADREAAAARAVAEDQSRLESAAEAEQEKVRQQIADAERQLQRLRVEASSIAQRLRELRREQSRAERAAVDAGRRAAQARQALEEASSDGPRSGDS